VSVDKITFDPNEQGGLELARVIVLQRLRDDHSWNQHGTVSREFDRYVDYVGDSEEGRRRFASLVQDILWELMIQGVIAPGLNVSNPNLPFFHITEYGKKVISEQKYMPHDPTGYLDRFRAGLKDPDSVVTIYLSESLECFARENMIASVVMLGIAAERVFLLLCNALLDSLSDPSEKTEFERILDRRSMKPKMDWVLNKIQKLQQGSPRPLPDNVNIMLCAIYDFIRCQRNDLGHPQDSLPSVTREGAYVNLQVFPGYCEMADQVVNYLRTKRV
jgi:hypothetical protein